MWLSRYLEAQTEATIIYPAPVSHDLDVPSLGNTTARVHIHSSTPRFQSAPHRQQELREVAPLSDAPHIITADDKYEDSAPVSDTALLLKPGSKQTLLISPDHDVPYPSRPNSTHLPNHPSFFPSTADNPSQTDHRYNVRVTKQQDERLVNQGVNECNVALKNAYIYIYHFY